MTFPHRCLIHLANVVFWPLTLGNQMASIEARFWVTLLGLVWMVPAVIVALVPALVCIAADWIVCRFAEWPGDA